MTDGYRFFSNTECEYFPCHDGADPERFNCMFCFCPLYMLGSECGGNFEYTKDGIKDCSHCMIPHQEKGYDYVIGNFDRLAAAGRASEGEEL